jgi:nucleoside-diphosphate-sugar epimerase
MNKALLAELVDESDLVVHLEAAVGVRLIVQSPVRTIETNIKGMELVLEAARKKRRWCSLLRPRRSTARTRTFPSVKMAIWSCDP